MMEKPLLSICIPTYNRCQYLRNSMNSIIGQKEFQDGRVEIVISDNVSTDDTESMVQEYVSQYKNIQYFRNAKNIHDDNFPLALRRGSGIYRKFSTDLFLYLPGSLGYICELVQQYSGTEKLMCWLDGKGNNIQSECTECETFDEIVRNVGWCTTWAGTFGLWESECEKITSDLSGSEKMIWQCEQLYKMAESKGKACLINRRLFLVQEVNGKNMSYGLYQVLHLNLLSIMDGYVDRGLLSLETYEKVRVENLYLFLTFFTRGKHKKKQWNFIDEDKTKEMVFNEVKQAGFWNDYQRSYRKYKVLYPLRISIKCVILEAYCTYLAFQIRWLNRKQVKK